MSRKIIYTRDNYYLFNKSYLNETLTEIYEKPIKTDYEEISRYFSDDVYLDTYRFKTESGHSYDLDFIISSINLNGVRTKNNTQIGKLITDDIDEENLSYRDIGFTPTEIKNIEIDVNIYGSKNDPYIKRTSRNEQYELLNKISYLINEYVNNNPHVYIYTIGKNTKEHNLSTYLYIFKKIFSNDFELFDVRLLDYTYGSFMFINKEILKNDKSR